MEEAQAGPGLADKGKIWEMLAAMWTKARPRRPHWEGATWPSWLRFCRVQEKVADMEILMNARI